MPQNDGALIIEDAVVRFLNFSGKEDTYNRAGDRNFCILLDQDLSEQMLKDGWNVKALKARADDPDSVPQPYIEVAVGFKVRAPRIVMIGETSRSRTELGEDTCGLLDDVDIVTVDVSIRPYEWEVNGKTGIKAYLKSAFVTIEEDFLDLKYARMDNPEGDHS